MKTCEQVAADVLARRDAYLRERAAKIKKARRAAAVGIPAFAAAVAAAALLRAWPPGALHGGNVASDVTQTCAEPSAALSAETEPTAAPDTEPATVTEEPATAEVPPTAEGTPVTGPATTALTPTAEEAPQTTAAPVAEQRSTAPPTTQPSTTAPYSMEPPATELTTALEEAPPATEPLTEPTSCMEAAATDAPSDDSAAIPERPALAYLVWEGRLYAALQPEPTGDAPAGTTHTEKVFVFTNGTVMDEALYRRFGAVLPRPLRIEGDPAESAAISERADFTLCVTDDGAVYGVTRAGAFPLREIRDISRIL